MSVFRVSVKQMFLNSILEQNNPISATVAHFKVAAEGRTMDVYELQTLQDLQRIERYPGQRMRPLHSVPPQGHLPAAGKTTGGHFT
jgi:hypothetical protein